MYSARDFWKAFGGKRFTKADLWRAFGNNHFPGFPTPEWLTRIGIGQTRWIEEAPGPRGGQGWRLTEVTVAAMTIIDAKACAKATRLAALLESVIPRLGQCHIHDGKIGWSFLPPVPVPGRHPDGRRRAATAAFSLAWPATATPDAIQLGLDHAAAHVADMAGRERERCISRLRLLDSMNLADGEMESV